MRHPYQQYENTPAWEKVKRIILDLEANNDIELLTPVEYVVGYLCREMAPWLTEKTPQEDENNR
ncbi:hypothetical protein SAMN04487825_10988 [Prevotella sp. kh1p2]|nr:hypothetical protein SAMN04487825_10988 [Prevotella sp. kh1p2]SNU11332.1 hypothetical protein SAMN06298210_10987 [Prevotellaceae bacterium KH2P17]